MLFFVLLALFERLSVLLLWNSHKPTTQQNCWWGGIYAAMVIYKKMDEYDPTNQYWPQYAKRLGHYIIANGIESTNRKCTVLLTVVATTTYELLHSFMAAVKPGNKS